MAVKYRARRPRASPLWQCLHACLDDFLTAYPAHYALTLGPLRPEASEHLLAFLRCGDLAQGFIRIACGECNYEYSNKRRRRLARVSAETTPASFASRRMHPRRRQPWRQLIIRVWGADPLRCPCCGALMHKQKTVEQPAEIQKTLRTLGLWEGLVALPPPHAPPQKWRSTSVWALDLGDSRIVDFESGFNHDPLPTDRRTKPPRERHLNYALDEETQAPPPDDSTESEIPMSDSPSGWQPKVEQQEDGLSLVFDGDPPPPDDLPIFWTD
jgi:hypothetical protein